MDENLLIKYLRQLSPHTVRLLDLLLSKTPVDLEVGNIHILARAAIFGNAHAVELLLARGADINKQDTFTQSTALHAACWNNQPYVVRVLLQNNARVDIKNCYGETAFQNAQKYPEILKILTQNIPPFSVLERTSKLEKIPGMQGPDIIVNPKGTHRVRVVCLSDTHNRYNSTSALKIPHGDILIHSGDFSNSGHPSELEKFNSFMQQLPHKHKILVLGNHDTFFQPENETLENVRNHFPYCTTLLNTSVVVEGINIYGTPYTGHHMAFHVLHDSPEMQRKLTIPVNTDILVTHVPPLGIADLAFEEVSSEEAEIQGSRDCCFCGRRHPSYYHWGSRVLLEEILQKKPKAHQFGHVHDSAGITRLENTVFINASIDLSPKPLFFDCLV